MTLTKHLDSSDSDYPPEYGEWVEEERPEEEWPTEDELKADERSNLDK